MTFIPPVEEVETRLRAVGSNARLTPGDEAAVSRLKSFRPAHAHVSQASLGVARKRRIRLGTSAVAALAAMVLANGVTVYYAPRYGLALADSPIGPVSTKVLQAVGLNGGDITVVGDSATSSGHTVRLVAGYADGLRTVLWVSIDGRGLTGDPKRYGMHPGDYGVAYDGLTLTDQFGRSYQLEGVGGPTELPFQPLAWPASRVGARLTLHITAVDAVWRMAQGTDATIQGDWTLHATLLSEEAHTLPLPSPIRTADLAYTFKSIRASGKTLTFRWTVAGAISDQLRQPPKPGMTPDTPVMRQYFNPRVYDAAGKEVQMEEWGFTWPKTGPADGEMTVFISGSGRYRIQLGDALATPDLQRWITVP